MKRTFEIVAWAVTSMVAMAACMSETPDGLTFERGAAERTSALSLTRGGKRTRGSNSYVQLPRNLQLADVDGDGAAELLQYSGSRIFVRKTNFEQAGLAHAYLDAPIKRLITGDFAGEGYDQVCAIIGRAGVGDTLTCYGGSPDHSELWWWFYQGSFIGASDKVVVGDFNGDGKDELWVLPQGYGWDSKLYRKDPAGGFVQDTGFHPLGANHMGPADRAYVADVDGDGRDDLVTVDAQGYVRHQRSKPTSGPVTMVFERTYLGSVQLGPDDEAMPARIDADNRDDFAVRNRQTGAMRFYSLQTSDMRQLPVAGGQINTDPNSMLVWTAMRPLLDEPGGRVRDDALVYNRQTNMIHRADARVDAQGLTYWWAYTQNAPDNHAWPEPSYPALNILTCHKPRSFREEEHYDANAERVALAQRLQPLRDYWQAMSYGLRTLQVNVLPEIAYPQWEAFEAATSRDARARLCLGTGQYPAGTLPMIDGTITPERDPHGRPGDITYFARGYSDATNAHFWALQQSRPSLLDSYAYSGTGPKPYAWSATSELLRQRVNQYEAQYRNAWLTTVVQAPELSAAERNEAGFMAPHRVLRLSGAGGVQTWRGQLAAASNPEGNGVLLVRVGEYAIEYRTPARWDRSLEGPKLLVLRRTGTAFAVDTNDGGAGAALSPGGQKQLTVNGRPVTVTFHSVKPGYVVDVTITY